MQAKRYLSCAETAKLVRKALAADFPGVKFSVRSKTYAGGASITAHWTDGPTTKQVEGTLSLYNGASFDGMVDLKSYHDSVLMTEDGPEVVHFGADYVHGSRTISNARRAIYRVEVRRFLKHIGGPEFNPNALMPLGFGKSYGPMGECEHPMLAHDSHRGEWGSSIIEQMCHARPWKGEHCPGTDHPLVMVEAYCSGCGRWQKGHELEPHTR